MEQTDSAVQKEILIDALGLCVDSLPDETEIWEQKSRKQQEEKTAEILELQNALGLSDFDEASITEAWEIKKHKEELEEAEVQKQVTLSLGFLNEDPISSEEVWEKKIEVQKVEDKNELIFNLKALGIEDEELESALDHNLEAWEQKSKVENEENLKEKAQDNVDLEIVRQTLGLNGGDDLYDDNITLEVWEKKAYEDANEEVMTFDQSKQPVPSKRNSFISYLFGNKVEEEVQVKEEEKERGVVETSK